MITNDGRVHIKRFMAKQVSNIAQSIGFGVGESPGQITDTQLKFEVDRSDINLVSYDFVNDKLIFKASIPDNFAGSIHEVGLFSMMSTAARAEFSSRLLTSFDSGTENWVDATSGTAAAYSTISARIGDDALFHQPASNGTKTDTLKDIHLNLGEYSSADQFVLALNADNAFTTSVRARFLTDVSNYYEINFGAVPAGYSVLSATKGVAAVTGTPSWSNISEIRMTTNSGSGGTSSVIYDGLRIEDLDTINSDDVMVSREQLATPFVKVAGMTQEIEFALDVSV